MASVLPEEFSVSPDSSVLLYSLERTGGLDLDQSLSSDELSLSASCFLSLS